MNKKLLSSVLAASLAVSMTAVSMPLDVFAVDTAPTEELLSAAPLVFPTGRYDLLLESLPEPVYTDEIYEVPSKEEIAVQLGSNFGTNTYNFSSLLSSTELTVYKEMLAALQKDPGAATINVSSQDIDVIARAFIALVMDCPEYVGLSTFSTSYSYGSGTAQMTLKYCDGQAAGNTARNSYNTVQNEVARLAKLSASYSTTYDKLQFFAHHMCDKVSYNYTAASSGSGANCWNAYGSLINGDGVCESYAEGFKLLCDAVSIPCILVVSDTHEWNAVYLGSSWYYVDTTWMDSYNVNGQYDEGWFMTGTNYASDSDHVQSGTAVLSGYSILKYPAISKTAYDPSTDTERYKPTNVRATVGVNSATLTWTGVSGATKYAIAYKNGNSFTTLTNNCTSTSYTANNLTGGKTYQFLVQAYVNGKWSSYTSADLVSVTPQSGNTKPTNVRATAGVNSATLTWTGVSGATKYAIAYKNGNSFTTLTNNCTSTSYTANNLTGGKTYQFLVQAYVNGKWSSYTSADLVSVTPQSGNTKPTNVRATAGVNSATLTWTGVSGATKYSVAYKTGSGYRTLTNTCTSTSYTANNLTGGSLYRFVVQAYVNGQWSSFTSSDLVSVTPLTGSSKPTNVRATAGVNSATFTWNAVKGATKYSVSYKTGSGYRTLTNTCTSTSYTANNLTGGSLYRFVVQAYVNGQWSSFTSSDLISVTPLTGSSKPTNVRATAGVNSATFTWNAVPGATKYSVAYKTGSGYRTLTNTCTSTSYTANNLTGGSLYRFVVQAYVNGQWSSFTSSDLISVTPLTGSSKPTNVRITTGKNSATLTWNAVPGATKYSVAYKTGSGYRTLTNTCTSTSYTAKNLTSGGYYRFVVQAYVNGQWSSFTSADLVSVTIPDT